MKYNIVKTLGKALFNWVKTFASGYGIGLALESDTIMLSVGTATLTALVTAAKNWYKNKDL